MSSKLCRTILLFAAVLALAAAAPAFAGQEPAPAPSLQAPAACPPAADLFAAKDQALVCKANDVAAVAAQPEFMSTHTIKYRGFCRCSCSFVRDCNTAADCGGSACLPGITCC
jgi:hypothetical protein